MTGIAALPNSAEWYLPYSPRAGALRNFYAPPGRPDHLFASIEVGGLLRSTDGGETWTLLDTYDDDIHHVTGHPHRPSEIWLALGWAALKNRAVDNAQLGGVARSDDGGQTWRKVIERDYTRAVIVPPARPDLVLASPARRSGARDGSWSPLTEEKHGSRQGMALKSRWPIWWNCFSPHPTAQSGPSVPRGACCAPNRVNGAGVRRLRPAMQPRSVCNL
jgi:hypothetical protein